MGKKQEGKKHRKHGRNKVWCQAYRARGQRERNKARKAEREAKRRAKKQGRVAERFKAAGC